MIKSENYGKIIENSQNLPENSLKNPKKFAAELRSAVGGGGPASPDRGGFFRFFDDRGDFRLIPPYLSLL